jgi:hypothetical protein
VGGVDDLFARFHDFLTSTTDPEAISCVPTSFGKPTDGGGAVSTSLGRDEYIRWDRGRRM